MKKTSKLNNKPQPAHSDTASAEGCASILDTVSMSIVRDDVSDIQAHLVPQDRPELVIGLVGPIGVDLDPVITSLKDGLAVASYSTYTIRLSKLIEDLAEEDFTGIREEERIGKLMDLGTRLRENSQRGDAAAVLAMAEIARIRQDEISSNATVDRVSGNAYILRSLKHPAEVDRLRTIYGKGFILISTYSPRSMRVAALAERIARSRNGDKKRARAEAEALVERDEAEDDKDLGQDVQDAFPLADLFVDARNIDRLRSRIERFLHLTFGNRFRTPTRDEYGMFHARAAALRSADLNRQVGAAIMQNGSDVVTVGCNDVPKFGGDQYWEGDEDDARDFIKGIDSSAEQRIQMLGELIGRLSDNEFLEPSQAKRSISELVSSLITGDDKKVLKGVGLMNLLEFGRSVHAEMAALMSAARLGKSVEGATLYCTTFPCHMCARHIVASGIKRVVYIEPYPKSKAKQLHADAIAVDSTIPSPKQVNFEPFQGVAPRLYQSIFSADDLRKSKDGKKLEWNMKDGKVRFQRYVNTYIDLETDFISRVLPVLQTAIRPSPPLSKLSRSTV